MNKEVCRGSYWKFDGTLNVHDCKDLEIEPYLMPHRSPGNRKKATWPISMFQTYSEIVDMNSLLASIPNSDKLVHTAKTRPFHPSLRKEFEYESYAVHVILHSQVSLPDLLQLRFLTFHLILA
jgi:hypothetical protein